ncbi:Phage-related replication protein-like protein [Isoalcanivorax pacificus W11-5]|uniref:Phage-related replication protein-like protein n=1 Tax=Isoalcanivorax pacificus W11-5 TaxID=391936 RepID=A0A0B4XPB5_9GAMM|nr:poly-gamma-glutamate hydrolase family protein [Isoalcanivorax pacificus]AJD48127.1 Phage-related replication protein-like protein [Isoalcanivorax pacificus W11-5]
MPDKYASFAELSAAEVDGAYRIELQETGSSVALIAPHAGKIEPGTSQICKIIAGSNLTYYLFEGCKASNNRDLHITSSRFDEPRGLKTAQSARIVVTFHGQAGEDLFVNVGGLAGGLRTLMIAKLKSVGFVARLQSNPMLRGLDPNNICNRGSEKKGLQLEISRGLRDLLITEKQQMDRFSSTVRSVLHGC